MYFAPMKVFFVFFFLLSIKSHGLVTAKDPTKLFLADLAKKMGLPETRLNKISEILSSEQTSPSLNKNDWIVFREKWLSYKNKSQTQWRQQDLIILTLAHLDDRLWQSLNHNKSFEKIRIYLYRTPSSVVLEACQSAEINPRVRLASCLAQYGIENTPALVSDEVVDFFAGQSSAFSSLIAEKAVVFEGFRANTFTDLIQTHEGFHSTMNRLSTLNRMSRLKKWVATPLAPDSEFDGFLSVHIERLAEMSAPRLEDLFIDTRFISAHHGVIMATLHHGLFTEVKNGNLHHSHPEDLFTSYPFHYIQKEQNWSDLHTNQQIELLAKRHQEWLENDYALLESLSYIQDVMKKY